MTKEKIHLTKSVRSGATALLLLPALAFGAPENLSQDRQTDESASEQTEQNGTSHEAMISAVKRALKNAQGLEGEAISVEMEGGTVALSGEVANILAHDRALRIASSVKGVRALKDNVTVRRNDRSDTEIERDVASAIALDPATEFWEIDAEVQEGQVSLSGTVESFAEKELAEKVVKGVLGVRSVENSIDVHYEIERTDRQIAHDVQQLLKWNTTVDSSSIDVDAENGIVTLSGTVDSLYEKNRAARLSRIAGVLDVDTTDLQVRWSGDGSDRQTAKNVSDDEIRESIRAALTRSPRVKTFEPAVEVRNGVVTLSGSVDNLKAKRAAAQAAQDTLGVKEVRNHLTVDPEPVVADAELEENVENALLRDPYVNSFEVDVAAIEGEIYLYGEVDSYFDKLEAGDAAARIAGVTDVHNQLDVSYDIPDVYAFYDWDPILYDYAFDYPYVGTKPDGEIRESIESQMAWSPFVDAGQVEVEVDNGVATLTGEVDGVPERRAATENALEGGAFKVVNRLDVSFGTIG